MRLPNLKGKGAAGFTLVEMAIVLVIIGIILAGVMKGRDIVRGAQVKQFSQQFAQKWGTIAQTYYDKTGRVLNDGPGNGSAGGTLDGAMDGGLGDNMNTANTGVLAILNRVGITPCTLIKSKLTTSLTTAPPQNDVSAPASCRGQLNLVATTVEGEYTGPINVQVDLDNQFILRTDADTGNVIERRNCVLLYQVPTDVAMGLDTAIDGTENGAAGSFVNLADNGTGRAGVASLVSAVGAEITAIAWPDAVQAQNHVCAIVLDF